MLKSGPSSEDTFLPVFRLLDPKHFKNCSRRWLSGLMPKLSGTIAVDGKTVRASGSGGETAIPELLDALYLEGFLVSIDTMCCQRANTEKIITMKADYLLAVKGSQPNFFQATQDASLIVKIRSSMSSGRNKGSRRPQRKSVCRS